MTQPKRESVEVEPVLVMVGIWACAVLLLCEFICAKSGATLT